MGKYQENLIKRKSDCILDKVDSEQGILPGWKRHYDLGFSTFKNLHVVHYRGNETQISRRKK